MFRLFYGCFTRAIQGADFIPGLKNHFRACFNCVSIFKLQNKDKIQKRKKNYIVIATTLPDIYIYILYIYIS